MWSMTLTLADLTRFYIIEKCAQAAGHILAVWVIHLEAVL
ncbi:hypothetical protein AB72_1046 [Escherichia coli 1-250-04_S1_C3]|nr:hypothetical protein AB72_1046 [Escherichia coli 1-250-04_S1_C3]KDX30443.1 hypothetical protein AB41_2169 [Escherichia coli 1-250-04_S1_C2]KDX31496.1 hypothetical protein AB13_2190 [Escherichia coli 1-250-04_S1_C1]